ncbi:MAG: alpha/beta fold hydrolase [Rhodobacteraceae bacterium]|nr:alpha/beta fold hydrolase [Paracoccaceae bacterium]
MVVEIVNGRRVGISRAGEGAPMLMLHCALAHRGALAPLMAQLPSRAFTAFDLPGHGESEFDEAVDIQAQAVETAVTLLEASGPSDVFGHSFGATVALKLALERPDLVRRLCLYEPVYFAVLAQANPKAYAAEAKASSAFTEASLANNWPTAARAFLARWGGEAFDALPLPSQAYILKTIPLIMASEASIIAPEKGANMLALMAGLCVPMLLMAGGSSPVVISEIATALAENGTGITQMQLQHAAHMGPISHPKDVAEIIAGFIA